MQTIYDVKKNLYYMKLSDFGDGAHGKHFLKFNGDFWGFTNYSYTLRARFFSKTAKNELTKIE